MPKWTRAIAAKAEMRSQSGQPWALTTAASE